MSNIPKPPKTKIGIFFEVSIESTSAAAIRAGYTALRERIHAYEAALKLDQNIIVTDSYITANTGDLLAAQTKSANTTEERLAAVTDKREVKAPATPTAKPVVATPVSAKPAPAKPAVKPVKETKAFDDEPPHIVVPDLAELKREAELKRVSSNSEPYAPPAASSPNSNDGLLRSCLDQVVRSTDKGTALITALVNAPRQPISIEALAKLAKVDVKQAQSWLQGAPGKYRFVERADGKGLYQFNPAGAIA